MVQVKVTSKSVTIRFLPEVYEVTSVEHLKREIALDNRLSSKEVSLTYYDAATETYEEFESGESLWGLNEKEPIEVFVEDKMSPSEVRSGYMLVYLVAFSIHYYPYLIAMGVLNVLKPNKTQRVFFWLVWLHLVSRAFDSTVIFRHSSQWISGNRVWWTRFLNLAIMPTLDFIVFFGPESLSRKNFLLGFLFHVNQYSSSTHFVLVALWVLTEVSLKISQSMLTSIRLRDPQGYPIPDGFCFNLVACPHYFFELLSWFLVALIVGNWAAWTYLLVLSYVLYGSARQQHRRYVRLHGEEYTKLNRKVLIPFLY